MEANDLGAHSTFASSSHCNSIELNKPFALATKSAAAPDNSQNFWES